LLENVKLLEGSVFFADSLKCWETGNRETGQDAKNTQRTRETPGKCSRLGKEIVTLGGLARD